MIWRLNGVWNENNLPFFLIEFVAEEMVAYTRYAHAAGASASWKVQNQ
ncbi:MAG: hypothetical protein ACNYPE_17340 [Candidatus Azotimanducaceae bacterium WSBS_2022_MAG_OTU7]